MKNVLVSSYSFPVHNWDERKCKPVLIDLAETIPVQFCRKCPLSSYIHPMIKTGENEYTKLCTLSAVKNFIIQIKEVFQDINGCCQKNSDYKESLILLNHKKSKFMKNIKSILTVEQIEALLPEQFGTSNKVTRIINYPPCMTLEDVVKMSAITDLTLFELIDEYGCGQDNIPVSKYLEIKEDFEKKYGHLKEMMTS